MNRSCHLLIGAASGIAIAGTVSHAPWVASAVVAAIAASLPDLDCAIEPPQRGRYQRAARPVVNPFEHRGLLHSFVTALVLGLGWSFLSPWVGWAFGIGWASHIVADSFSIMGTPWFYPVINQRLRLLPHAIKLHSGTWWFDYPAALASLIVALLLVTH